MAKKITKQDADRYLYEVAKEYRKINRGGSHIELILVGGGAIMLKYNFRNATDDLDAMIRGSISTLKEIANKVGDKNDLVYGWLNSDFSKTTSFSKELVLRSDFYKTFCGCLDVRIVPDKYLIAMKLVSGRKYKHDRSDIVGILMENIQRQTPITKEQIFEAVLDLYKENIVSEEMQGFLDNIFSSDDLEGLYYKISGIEKSNYNKLVELLEKHPELNNNTEKAFSYLDDFENIGEDLMQEEEGEEEYDNNT